MFVINLKVQIICKASFNYVINVPPYDIVCDSPKFMLKTYLHLRMYFIFPNIVPYNIKGKLHS